MNGEHSADFPVTVARVCRQGRRAQQEDASGYLVHGEWLFLVVADGLGGLSHGGYAANKACETFLQAVARFLFRGGNPVETLANAGLLVNGLLLGEKANRKWQDLGTTVAMVLSHGDKLTVAHAGDSRVYLVTTDDVQLLTRDHAPTQDLLEGGLVTTLSQARSLVGSGVTRCLGDEQFPGLEIQQMEVDIQRGILLVLTTDGAHEFLQPADFLHQGTGSASVAELTERLANLAWQRGSEDNITVLAAEVGNFPRSTVRAAPVFGEACSTPGRLAGPWRRWAAAALLGFILGLLASWALKWPWAPTRKQKPAALTLTNPTQSLDAPLQLPRHENRKI